MTDQRKPGQCVIFLHIGRTGGTTLWRVLRRQYPRRASFSIDSTDVEGSLRGLGALPHARRAGLQLVRGHGVFGVHELIRQPVTYITFMRDPVDRVLSAYHYVRTRPYHELHEQVSRRNLSFAEFVRSGLSLETDNWQTRVIAGDLDTPFGRCTPDLLERAKRTIAEWFSVVGLLERFDESLVLCRRRLGWRWPPVHGHRNAARSRRPVDDLAPAELEAALELNQLDCALYAWVEERFEQGLASDPAASAELRRLRALNRACAPVVNAEVRAVELVRDLVRGRSD
jgi:hypothetical protein